MRFGRCERRRVLGGFDGTDRLWMRGIAGHPSGEGKMQCCAWAS
jgi:hypothetical protein